MGSKRKEPLYWALLETVIWRECAFTFPKYALDRGGSGMVTEA
jgi:hypothetical protein